jgi:hypothetical protein
MKKSKENGNLSEMPMAFRAEEALKKAVARAIADHKRTGDPIVVWQNGSVVKIPPEQIEVREPAAEYKTPNRKSK